MLAVDDRHCSGARVWLDGGARRGDARRVRIVCALLVVVASVAHADPPRWRARATLAQGFGGARGADDSVVARFATMLELGARVWGPLSLTATAIGTLAGEYSTTC